MLGTENLTAHDCQSFISRHLSSVKSHLAVVIVCQISDLVVGYTILIGENFEDSFGTFFFALLSYADTNFHNLTARDQPRLLTGPIDRGRIMVILYLTL
jgi:hypothetical protein